VVETDIANCFSAIPHEELMRAVEQRISDQGRPEAPAGVGARARRVMEKEQVWHEVTGTLQGGPISTLLCSAYMHQLDRV
jgi:retron-type reverse transcriptase